MATDILTIAAKVLAVQHGAFCYYPNSTDTIDKFPCWRQEVQGTHCSCLRSARLVIEAINSQHLKEINDFYQGVNDDGQKAGSSQNEISSGINPIGQETPTVPQADKTRDI